MIEMYLTLPQATCGPRRNLQKFPFKIDSLAHGRAIRYTPLPGLWVRPCPRLQLPVVAATTSGLTPIRECGVPLLSLCVWRYGCGWKQILFLASSLRIRNYAQTWNILSVLAKDQKLHSNLFLASSLRISCYSPPKTFFRISFTRCATLLRILPSSSPTFRNRPSSALLVV